MEERLKLIRTNAGLSQEEFGNRIGIKSRAHVSSLESGKRTITDRIVSDVCREFNVNELWLRTGQGEMFRTADDDFDILAGKISVHGDEFIKGMTKILWTFDEEELFVIKKIVEKIKNSPDL